VTGSTIDDHLEKIWVYWLQLHGLKLNKMKCAFLMPQVEHLGHKIDQHGLHPTKEKVKAIREAPQLQKVNELKSFLGIISYYGKFMPIKLVC